MRSKLLTIVVPSYNAERYLEYNLDSLCHEDIAEFLEVIVVDDGSKDRTSEIIDRYAEKYPDIIVPVHKENGGHGSGINTGIRLASGKYFKVIDADDWADIDELRSLINYIKEHTESSGAGAEDNKADMIAGGFYWVYGHDESCEKKAEFDRPFDGVVYNHVYDFDEIAEKAYIKMHSLTIATDILKEHDIKVDEHCYYVDTEYILYPIPYVNTVVFLDDHLYRYSIEREGQSMNPKQMMKNKSQFDHVLSELFKFYERVKEMEFVSEKKRMYIEHLIARVYAGRIKILLWDNISPKTRRELVDMERELKRKYPEIYRANLNKAVGAMRASGHLLYYPAAIRMHI